jgi:endonuclease YncB( thermonuclease family)
MVIAAILLLSAPTVAQTLVDGDTLRVGGTTYRLYGIDAPETKQRCGEYPAGELAVGMLEKLIRGRALICEPKATDRYGRTVAICWADGEDVGKAMVRAGMAWAFTRYSRDYATAEAQARAKRVGVHAQVCELPWEWRAQHR